MLYKACPRWLAALLSVVISLSAPVAALADCHTYGGGGSWGTGGGDSGGGDSGGGGYTGGGYTGGGGTGGGYTGPEQYVALGDSYSAGTGTESYYDSCKRSKLAYPHLVDNALADTVLTAFPACHGDTTFDVLTRQIPNYSSPLTSNTRWVTITIGGNDAGFSHVLQTCKNNEPDPESLCSAAIDEAQDIINEELPGRLASVYARIRSHAPNADVVVLSYPRLFYGTINCSMFTRFSPTEMSRINDTAILLRNVTYHQTLAAGPRFHFQDAVTHFFKHEVCSQGAPPWITNVSFWPISESFHPSKEGHSLGYMELALDVMND